jgi:carbon monoxide dehydrogenase subunit G
MILEGEFTTTASRKQLVAALAEPIRLRDVPSLDELHAAPNGGINTLYAAATGLGTIPIRLRLSVIERGPGGAVVLVQGTAVAFVIDATVDLAFAESNNATLVRWRADLVVRGLAAAITQRVSADIASDQIGKLLAAAAGAAAALGGRSR